MPRAFAAWLGLVPLAAACGSAELRTVDGVLTVTPPALDYGRVAVGVPARRPLQLRNDGERPLAWSTRADFPGLRTEPSGGELQPGERADVEAILLGEAPRGVEVALVFDTTSSRRPTVEVPVTGTVAPGLIVASPARLDFGPVRTGRWADATVLVENLGPDPLELRPRLTDHPAALTLRSAATLVVPAGGGLSIDLRFAPTERGRATGTLVLGGECTGACTIPLEGLGIDASVVCEPNPLDFAFVNLETCGQGRLTCTNLGPVEVTLAALTLDPERGPFSADPPPLPAQVAPGESVTVGVAFCPDDGRPMEALITVDTLEPDVGPRRSTVPVLGEGGGPDIEVTPEPRFFPGTIVGEQRTRTITVHNRGDAPLSLASLRFDPADGPFGRIGPPPAPVPAGGARTIELVFAPRDFGVHRATLRVASDDPDTPVRSVGLEGEGLGPGLCVARWVPEALEFGFVPVGSVVDATLELSAGGVGPCRWYEPRIEGHPAFSFVTAPPRDGLLPPGARATFAVRYAPTAASAGGGDSATLRIDVPWADSAPLEAPLAGLADSSDLVVFPSQVDFGPTPVDVERRRSVFVFNTGTQDRRLTEQGLAAPVAGLRALTPSTQRTLRAGEGVELRLAYRPTATDSFAVPFEIRAEGLPAPVRVPVRGEARADRCGHVTGAICAPHGEWPSVDTEVTVTDRAGTRTLRTDENGGFFAHCVTPGTARIEARRGHYTVSRTVSVTEGRVTPLPADTCLEAPAAEQVAVVTGLYDEIEAVLAEAGVPHLVLGGRTSPPRLLRDADLLRLYDVVLLNCGFDDTETRDPTVQDNLRDFVLDGGSLYASDLAYDAIEGAFPELLELSGDDAVRDAAQVGIQPPFRSVARSPGLLRALGAASATLNLDGDYALVLGAAPGATVELVGESAGPSGGLRPLLVRYRPTATSGVVVFTLAHASARAVDPALRTVLEYAVFGL